LEITALVIAVPNLAFFKGEAIRGDLSLGPSGWATGGITYANISSPEAFLDTVARIVTDHIEGTIDPNCFFLPHLRADAFWETGVLLRPHTASPFGEAILSHLPPALGTPIDPDSEVVILVSRNRLNSAHDVLTFTQSIPENLVCKPLKFVPLL
jgi:hypothetical protein